MVLSLSRVPLAQYGTPGTPELSDALRDLVPHYDAILMANHGVVTFGEDLLKAFFHMETVEHFARISLVTEMLGKQVFLSSRDVQKLLAARSRYFGPSARPMLPWGSSLWSGDDPAHQTILGHEENQKAPGAGHPKTESLARFVKPPLEIPDFLSPCTSGGVDQLETLINTLCGEVHYGLAAVLALGVTNEKSYGQGAGFISTLAIDPSTPATLYAGTNGGVFKSTNGGASWQPTGSKQRRGQITSDRSVDIPFLSLYGCLKPVEL